MLSKEQRVQLRSHLLAAVENYNHGWYKDYMDHNLDAIVKTIQSGGGVLAYGFRGIEVKQAMKKLGML